MDHIFHVARTNGKCGFTLVYEEDDSDATDNFVFFNNNGSLHLQGVLNDADTKYYSEDTLVYILEMMIDEYNVKELRCNYCFNDNEKMSSHTFEFTVSDRRDSRESGTKPHMLEIFEDNSVIYSSRSCHNGCFSDEKHFKAKAFNQLELPSEILIKFTNIVNHM